VKILDSKQFDGKTVLITGGAGSLGQALTRKLLEYDVHSIRVYSRNESKQVEMESKLKDSRVRYLIGDIRDLPRLTRAMEGVDIVFHAAALKHVPVIEYNPFEAVNTNVIGTQNVISACIAEDVEIAVAIGTDKAVSPLNAYGATKLLMEKLFISANNYLDKRRHKTKFIALRYGNVLGSSGSVVPLFINQIKNNKKITITDQKMTRFSITMDDALNFILESTLIGKGSEVFIPKLLAYQISDIQDALFEILKEVEIENISLRPGEKMDETLINEHEARYAWELGNKYVLFSSEKDEEVIKQTYQGIQKFSNNLKNYSSNNVELIGKEELKKIFEKSSMFNST
jgi:UDP-N-acetylglucosamine 4,6-dehydratase/5-epimerase